MPEKIGQDESVARQVTCRQCGAILKYYPREIEVKTYSYMGESEQSSFIKCVECKTEVTVKGS
jgi:ribosomal protein S27E